MSDETANAIVAIVLGTAVAVVLVLPVAGVRYRRTGRLGAGDLAVLFSAAVYGLALGTYTLLPLPSAAGFSCAGSQLEPLASLRPLAQRDFASAADLIRDPVFLQAALNLLLFVPLGYYVRRVLGRGFVVAGLVGLALSVLIEVTQLTGVWTLYRCAYRVFDVDDVLLNTAGAVVGSVLSLLVVRRGAAQRPRPGTVTLGRRVMGLACDALFVVLVAVLVAMFHRGWVDYGPGQRDPDVRTALLFGVPFVVEAVFVLLASRTVGEWVVDLRAIPRVRRIAWLSRAVKLAVGVAPPFALAYWLEGWAVAVGLSAYALVTLVVVWGTRGHRGPSHVLSGMDLVVDRPPAGPVPDDLSGSDR